MSTDPTLDRVRLRFDPNRLLQARLARALKKVELARLIGLTPAAIGQYELGHTKPSVEVIARLALALQFPVGFFEVGRPMLSLSEKQTHFRRLRSTSAAARSLQIARLSLLEELVARTEQDVDLPLVNIPALPLITATRAEIEEVASSVRKVWHLSDGPIVNVVGLLEGKGCIVARLASEAEGVDAYSRWSGKRPIVVLTRDKADPARSNFDAAHELGHLVMHQDPLPGSRQAEEQAQMFASAFLMPAESIRRELRPRFEVHVYSQLKTRWHVSIQALLYRARVLEVMSEPAFRRAMRRISLWGWRTGEPSHSVEFEEPYVLRAALGLIEQVAGLDSAAVASQLFIPPDLLEEFVPPDRQRPSVMPQD